MVFLSSLNTAQQSRPVRGPLPGKANILCNQGFPSKGQKLFPVLHWPASVGRARCVQARQHASFKRWQTCAVLQQNIYNSLSQGRQCHLTATSLHRVVLCCQLCKVTTFCFSCFLLPAPGLCKFYFLCGKINSLRWTSSQTFSTTESNRIWGTSGYYINNNNKKVFFQFLTPKELVIFLRVFDGE